MEINVSTPFIVCIDGIKVNKPIFMIEHPALDHHSIYVSSNTIHLPLLITGVFSYLPTFLPTDNEVSFNQ